jgi:hypothetical protein
LSEVIGQMRTTERAGKRFDIIALPHPSGASPWHRIEPGKSLTRRALELIREHPAWKNRTRLKQLTPRRTEEEKLTPRRKGAKEEEE